MDFQKYSFSKYGAMVLASYFVFCGVSYVSAETKTYHNLGFLAGNIWYSKDPFFAGDTVRIYSAVYNSGVHDLVGAVEFLDNGVLLGSVQFSVQGKGRMKDIWIDWIPTKGDHKIFARITNAKLAIIGGREEPIVIASAQSGESTRFTDSDTDRDGIGDREDPDDDNDTLSDVEEIKRGTNQYQKDSDKNGITDDKEVVVHSVPITHAKNTATARREEFALSAIRSVIDRAADIAGKKIDVLRKDIAADLKGTASTAPQDASPKPNVIFQKPLEYGYFLALSLASFVFNNKIILYLLLMAVAYKLARITLRRFLSR